MPEGGQQNRFGGMALANGLLVHGADHWAAAIRDDDGRVRVSSGRKPRLVGGPLGRIPLVRGVLRLGESMLVVPAARRGLPEARLAMERGPVGVAMLGSAATAALARRRLRSVFLQEAVGALAGLAPALVAVRGSPAAIWHGVEHKSIAAYEAGGAEELAHAGDHAKEHHRCGGNLVLPLLVTTIIGNTVARKLSPRPSLGLRLGTAALATGASVEVFAFAARHPEHPVARAVHRVGHALQAGLSTREPGEAELSVGRAAMTELLRLEDAPPA